MNQFKLGLLAAVPLLLLTAGQADAQVAARPPAQKTGPITITGEGSTGPVSGMSVLPVGAQVARSLADLSGRVYDATSDVLNARKLPGFNGDDAVALNKVLLTERAVVLHPVQPSSSLNLNIVSGVVMPMSGQRLEGLGGFQAVQFNRDLACTVDTIRAGDPNDATKGAGSVHVDGIWFTHPGRLGYNGGDLVNRLTANQSHLAVYGGQHSYIRVGGYGACHVVSIYGGASTNIDSPFTFGGVWNIANPNAQEAISHIRFTSSPLHGHGTSGYVHNYTLYGGNTTAQQTYAVGNKQYTSTRRIGPKHAVLIESLEDGFINTGISAGMAHSNFGLISSKAAAGLNYITNIAISSNHIDESNENGVFITRTSADAEMIVGVDVHNNFFNGQAIGKTGLHVDGQTYGVLAVNKLTEVNNVYRAHTGTPVRLTGADGGHASMNRISGYNMAANDTGAGGGLDYTSGRFIGGLTRNFQTRDDVYGGGPNNDVEPNNCQWGYTDAVPANRNTYRGARLAFEGAQGGVSALGLAGGSMIQSGKQYREPATNYVPAITSSAGAITAAAVQGALYSIEPGTRWVTVKVQVLVSNNGTGAGSLNFALPFPAAGGAGNVGAGLVIGGKSLSVYVSGGANVAQVFDYTGAYPAANNATLDMQIRYEADI